MASYLGLSGRQIAAIDVLNNRYPTYDSGIVCTEERRTDGTEIVMEKWSVS